jgi:hypothetical protein
VHLILSCFCRSLLLLQQLCALLFF